MTRDEKARRNMLKVKACTLHDFDWKQSIKNFQAWKAKQQERYGVEIPHFTGNPLIIRCRCKNCGGVMSVGYAAPYMDAVNHIKKQEEYKG